LTAGIGGLLYYILQNAALAGERLGIEWTLEAIAVGEQVGQVPPETASGSGRAQSGSDDPSQPEHGGGT
jgi:hypothetical protein